MLSRSHALAITALRHVEWDADSTIEEIEEGRLSEVSRSAIAGADLVDHFRGFLADMRLALTDVDLDRFVDQYSDRYLDLDVIQLWYPAVDVLRYYADVDPATVVDVRIAA